MKNFLLGTVAALAMVSSASAADMAARPYTKAPVIPIQVTNWTGFYVGAEGGGAWGSDRLYFPGPLTTTNNFDTSGGIAGGVVGFNYQAPGSNWVFGVEGNFDWAN